MVAQLIDLAPDFAARFGSTAHSFEFRRKLIKDVMQAEAPPGTKFGSGRPIQATPLNAGLIMVSYLDAGASPDELAERTQRVWRAAYSGKEGAVCPVAKVGTAGAAIVKLIEDAALRRRLDFIELDRATLTLSLVWQEKERRRPSVFHPYRSPEDWKVAVSQARQSGPIPLARLAADVLDQVVALIERHNG